LRLTEARTRRALDELQEVVVSFLEHSQIYRERVKDHLKLAEDCLCIVKSSEGLSQVFTQMEQKEMLPFGAVLMRISGAVRPFERIGLFLIPVSSLPGITESNVRAYIGRRIIPEVETEREAFLGRLSPRLARQAEPISYKYMAFLLRRGSIAHDVLNRKFNREFNAFIVDQQTSANLAAMKQELGEVVRTRDLLALVNWSSFADLNRDQKELVEAVQLRISAALDNAGIGTLPTLASATPEEFLNAIWPVVRRRTTRRKAINLSKKIVGGAHKTVDVLRRNGVRL